MSIMGRLGAAYGAFTAPAKAQASVRLKRPPKAPVGPKGERTATRLREADPGGDLRRTQLRLGRTARRRIAPLPIDRVRWLRADIEAAQHQANGGTLARAAQIAEWCKEDLVVGSLFSTRCSVPRLPREWRGDDEARIWLQGEGRRIGVFDKIFPPGELEELAIDHLDLGVGVGIFVQAENAELPELVRLDNQFLRYLPGEDRWQYQGWSHTYDVEPGNGVWFLHANGKTDPWRRGIWAGLGYDQVSEDGAGLHRDAFIWKFGNPLVLAKYPTGSSEGQKGIFVRAVLNWALGTVGVSPGYDVDLLQPKAEGREVFNDAEARVERRAMMRIAGQIVTSLGGPGFANAEIFAQIASFLVARTGQDLCTTVNAQGIEPVLAWAGRAGLLPANDMALQLSYDTTPPQARKAEAEAISAVAKSFVDLQQAGFDPDPEEFRARFRLPVRIQVPAHFGTGSLMRARMRVTSLPIVIEVPDGQDRTGFAPDGTPWRTTMQGASYGSIEGTVGLDGEAIDVYVACPAANSPTVYVLEQLIDGKLDEYKAFVGFVCADDAIECATRHLPSDKVGPIYPVPSNLIAGLISSPSPRSALMRVMAARRAA